MNHTHAPVLMSSLDMADNASGNKLGKRKLCGHCNEEVSNSLFYRHKKMYYDEQRKQWCKEPVAHRYDEVVLSKVKKVKV